jgi:hypothetical protein
MCKHNQAYKYKNNTETEKKRNSATTYNIKIVLKFSIQQCQLYVMVSAFMYNHLQVLQGIEPVL